MYYEYKLFREKKFILQTKSKSKVSFNLQEEVAVKKETVSDPVIDVKLAPLVLTSVSCCPSWTT